MLGLLLAPGLQPQAIAHLRVSGLFAPGMVLQCEQSIPIWGWDTPGTRITISFLDRTATCVAGHDGKWMARLEPLPARAKAASMTISSPETTIAINDVVVGEVWLCSGQSNMEFSFWQLVRPAKEERFQPVVDELRRIMNTEADPLLRTVTVRSNYVHGYRVDDFNNMGWEKSAPGANQRFSGVAYFFGKELRRRLDVPVGLVACASGATSIRPFIPAEQYQATPEQKDEYEAWQAKLQDNSVLRATTAAYVAEHERWATLKSWGLREPSPRVPRDYPDRQQPCGYYNGMIHPLVPFAVKGVIWYQGEADKADGYQQLQTALIAGWREKWGRPDMPFYWAQLSSRGKEPTAPDGPVGYAGIRDAQFNCLAIPHTGMAVTIDVGEHSDVHPHNKIDVGKRLALWALADCYGLDLPARSGPLYRNHVIHGDAVAIRFDHVGSGLTAGKKHLWEPARPTSAPLACFAIRGRDGGWKWGNAVITAPDTVTVTHPEVGDPVEVRYAWAAAPLNANLYNREGLPASPFSTLSSNRRE